VVVSTYTGKAVNPNKVETLLIKIDTSFIITTVRYLLHFIKHIYQDNRNNENNTPRIVLLLT